MRVPDVTVLEELRAACEAREPVIIGLVFALSDDTGLLPALGTPERAKSDKAHMAMMDGLRRGYRVHVKGTDE